MIQAAMKVVEYMNERGLSTGEQLRLLGSVSRLNSDAVAIKNLLYLEGLTEAEQMQVVRAIRAMIKPRKPREDKGKASK